MSIDSVSSIEGPLPKDRKRRMLMDNPNIVFLSNDKNEPVKYSNSYGFSSYPGDLIKKSASLRLGALSVGVATGIYQLSGISDDPTVLVAGGIISLGLYVAGEITQINAGKLMKSEKIAIKPATEGIGLSLHF